MYVFIYLLFLVIKLKKYSIIGRDLRNNDFREEGEVLGKSAFLDFDRKF